MGMFDTLQQGGKSAVGAMAPGPGGANGGSFAQKQQMRANPIMKGRPATTPSGNQPMQMAGQLGMQPKPNPFGAAPGMTPNAMGARPALNPMGAVGMMGSRNQIAAKPKPIGGTMAGQIGGSPQNYNPMQSPDLAQPIPKAPSGLMTPQLPNLVPPQSEGATTGGLAAMDPNQMQGEMLPLQGSVGMQAPPFGGMQPGSPSFQAMIEQLGASRPDVMNRGLGPSTEMFGGQAMQEMNPMQEMQQPVQMDENGLEPRRGAR